MLVHVDLAVFNAAASFELRAGKRQALSTTASSLHVKNGDPPREASTPGPRSHHVTRDEEIPTRWLYTRRRGVMTRNAWNEIMSYVISFSTGDAENEKHKCGNLRRACSADENMVSLKRGGRLPQPRRG